MIYLFDGSYKGFLSAVFDAFERRHFPALITTADKYQPAIFDATHEVITDVTKAARVQKGLEKRIGTTHARSFYTVFLSEDEKVWNASFRMLVQIFNGAHDLMDAFGDADVLYFAQVLKMVGRERHRMKAFIRFSKTADNLYFAIIEPDFNVLPLILKFFKNRYTDQAWMIYDVKRRYGMYYDTKTLQEVTLSTAEKNELSAASTAITLDERDALFQRLWQRYFKSTNIVERKNMKLHIQYVPKRYWKYLVEKQPLQD